MSVHGRVVERERLAGLVLGESAQLPSLVIIEGEAGIGKSALVRWAVAAAAEARVVTIVIEGLDTPDAPSMLDRAHRETGESLRPTVDDVEDDALSMPLALPNGPLSSAMRWATGLYDVLDSSSGADRPVLFVVEDLHDLHDDSLEVLRLLVPRLVGRPIAVVTTVRPAPRPVALEQLLGRLDDLGASRIELSPLAPNEIHEIVADIVGAPPGPNLEAYLEGANGNPLVVEELLKTLRNDGAIEPTETGRMEIASTGDMPPLALAVLRRSRMVGDEALDLLRMAAVLGRHFRVIDLVAMSGRDELEVISLLDEAARTGLLTDEAELLGFRHALVHDALYRDIPSATRSALHRRAAVAMSELGGSVAQVCTHLAPCLRPGDPVVWALLLETVRRASKRAPGQAAQLLEYAVEAADQTSSEFPELLAEHALALVRLGDAGRAAATAERALAMGCPPASELAARVVLAHCHLVASRNNDARTEIERAAAIEGIGDSDRLRCRALAAYYQFWALDLRGAAAAAAEVLAHSGELTGAHRDEVAGRCHEVLALAALAAGHTGEALDHADRAFGLIGRGRVHAGGTFVHQTRALALVDNDRLDDAIGMVLEGLRLGEDIGAIDWQIFYATSAAMMHVVAGDLDGADALADTALAILDGRIGSAVAGLPHAVHARTAAYRGDDRGAAAALQRAAVSFAASGPVLGSLAMLTWQAEIHLAAGEDEPARDCLRAVWAFSGPAPYLLAWRSALPLIVAHLGAADPEIAVAAMDAAQLGGERSRTPSAVAAAHRAKGLYDDDADLLIEAAEGFARGGRPLEALGAGIDAARAMMRGGRSREAHAQLEALAVRADELAVGGLARSIEALRIALPGPLAVRSVRGAVRPRFGWESLTTTQRLVAQMTAQGLTNRQIGEELGISRRTVETHLSNTFNRLGITSRSQLAAEIGRRLG